MEQDLPPRIIKKVNKHGGHHGGAWKVAYADFVTAMMALFIVLWILGQSEDVQKSVAGYFKDPIGFSSSKGDNIMPGGNTPQSSSGTAQGIDAGKSISSRVKEMEALKQMGEKLLGELSKDENFKSLVGQIKIEFVNEGLRIEIVDSSKDLFFEIGTAKLTEEAKLLLMKIGDNIAKLPNKIIIEGHTDARPYSGGSNGYTNFELSADRANSARRALTSGKLTDTQVFGVKGYADRKLRDPEHPYSFVNRRISIIVKYSDGAQ